MNCKRVIVAFLLFCCSLCVAVLSTQTSCLFFCCLSFLFLEETDQQPTMARLFSFVHSSSSIIITTAGMHPCLLFALSVYHHKGFVCGWGSERRMGFLRVSPLLITCNGKVRRQISKEGWCIAFSCLQRRMRIFFLIKFVNFLDEVTVLYKSRRDGGSAFLLRRNFVKTHTLRRSDVQFGSAWVCTRQLARP